MAFPINGENHHKAIKSEKDLLSYKSKFEFFYGKEVLDIVQKGGTKTKVDNLIYFSDGSIIPISLKSKKNLKSGSFDYVNTSSFNWLDFFPKTLSIYNDFKNSKDESAYRKLNIEISNELSNISDSLLTKLFIENVINKYNDLSLVIINEKDEDLYCDVKPPSFKVIEDGGTLRLKKSDKIKSSCIIEGIAKDGTIIDIGLRIRVHLNNGKSKWLGLKEGSSLLVIKFQQDSVYKIV
jgi:hypothetical protein